jgi:hypothetical protein
VKPPIKIGQVVVNNIRGTEVDIVATGELKISMTVISALHKGFLDSKETARYDARSMEASMNS